MNRYERVTEILDNAIGGPMAAIGAHGAFWRGLTRNQFVGKMVFRLAIVTVNDGAGSNLVKALRGEAPFGADLPVPPPVALYPRMPDGLPPVADTDIAFIQKWIDDGCPEDPYVPGTAAVSALSNSGSGMGWRPTGVHSVAGRYDDVWFVDPGVGWAVNSNAQIWHTRDGGQTWTPQFEGGKDVYLRCVAFASPARGWAGTLMGPTILYETRDAGATWSPVPNLPGPSTAPTAVCGLRAVNESVVYAVGSNEPAWPVRLMKTTDGGTTWSAWDMRRWADNLIDVYFPSTERGWVVGGRTDDPRDPHPAKPKLRPVVLYTEDGGRSWIDQVDNIRQRFPLGEWGWKIQFIDNRIGFISLQNYDAGAMLTTTDGGLTWARRLINDPQKNASLEGIGFLDSQHGWVGGWGDRARKKRTSSETFDGGLTWRDANEIGRNINRFRFFGNPVTVGYAAGETVYKFAPAPVTSPTGGQPSPVHGGHLLENDEPIDAVGQANISITVPEGTSRLTVRVWDPDGPLVRTLIDEVGTAPGNRLLTWDGTDERGQRLPSRAFVLRVTADETSESTLVLVR